LNGMAEGNDQTIDSAQKRLESQREQQKDKDLAATIRKYGDAFFKEVDSFQGLAPNVKSPDAKTYFDEGKGEVSSYLLRLAARGQWLLDHPVEAVTVEDEKDKKTGKKESVPVPKENVDNMDALATSLRGSLAKYRENLQVIIQVDASVEAAQKENEIFEKLEKDKKSGKDVQWQLDRAIALFAQAKKGLVDAPNLPADYRGKRESLIEKYLGKLVDKKIALELQKSPDQDPENIKARVLESVDALSSPKIMEQYWLGLRMFEKGKLPEAKVALLQFRDKDMKAIEFQENKKLKGSESQYLEKVQTTLDEIDGLEKGNKEFFEGARLMDEHDFIGAKAAFKKFLAEHENDKIEVGKPDFRLKARTELRNIALLQVADVKGKFLVVPKPTTTKLVDAGNGKFMDQSEMYDSYLQAIDQIEKLIRGGKYNDYTDAYNEVMKGKKFPDDVNFNFLSDEASLDKGKGQLLELARKYRANKQYDLAEQAYMQYLSGHMNQLLEKDQKLSYEGFLRKYDSSPKLNSAIQKRIDEEKGKHDAKAAKLGKAWAEENTWNESEIRSQIWKEAYSQMLPTEVQNRQAEIDGMGQASFDTPEAKAAWEELANMKGLHNKGTWKEPFSLSDEQLMNVIMTVPLLFARRLPGRVTGGLMQGESAMLGRNALALGSRGGLLRMARLGALGLSSALVLEGCTTYPSFWANFDMRNYESLSEDELKKYEDDYEGVEIKFSNKVLQDFIANTVIQETGLKINLNNLYGFSLKDDPAREGQFNLQSLANFSNQAELEALLRKDMPGASVTKFTSVSSFTFVVDGKTYNCKIGGLGLSFEDVSKQKFMDFDLANTGFGDASVSMFHNIQEFHEWVDGKASPYKTRVVDSNGGMVIIDKTSGVVSYVLPDKPNEIHTIKQGYAGLIEFLDKNNSAQTLKLVLRNINVNDIESVEQLREIAKRLPPNSNAFRDFVKGSISYAANDDGSSDEYRSPIDTLKSGWGDCDDYAVLNAFWAYMRGYTTRVIKIKSSADDKDAHVFVVYTDGKTGNAFAMDVDQVHPIASADENGINAYLATQWPTYSINEDDEGGIMLVAAGRPDSWDKTHHEPKKKSGTKGNAGKEGPGGVGSPSGGS